jgi:excisionase family DNA binding protein
MQLRTGEAEKPAGETQVPAVTVGDAVRAHVNQGGPDGLLDYEAAARYLGTTPRHVRELWAKRYVAAVKVGRRVRFRVIDLDAFIAAHRVPPVR